MDDLLRLAIWRAEVVREVETGADLGDDLGREPPRTPPVERSEALQNPEKVAAGHVLPRDVGRAVGLAEDIDLDDVGVDQARRDLRLIGEHAQEAGPFEQVGVDALDGHRFGEATDPDDLCPINVSHAPRGDLVDQDVFAEAFHLFDPTV